jgi:hypothetical protein
MSDVNYAIKEQLAGKCTLFIKEYAGCTCDPESTFYLFSRVSLNAS